jgi:ribosome recycling factor
MAYDEVELSDTRACLGRLYFHVPGGIKYGQYWLNVKFENSLVRVPFRILTEEEEKLLSKNYKSIEKQVKEAFAPPKKKK